jgi:Domain of unknown function (DUF4389)
MDEQPPSTEPSVTSSELFGGDALVAVQPQPIPVGAYPVQVTFERAATSNRFFAVPLLGLAVKEILLIPHIIILSGLGWAVFTLFGWATWIPVLARGKYPKWAADVVGLYLRWVARYSAYLFGLTDEYPPMATSVDEPYPVRVDFALPERSSMFWAIPIIGFLAKSIILIPHIVVLSALSFVVILFQLGLWIPVLFRGKYPELGYELVGGTIRWQTRVSAYFFGLTDAYPPFSLN